MFNNNKNKNMLVNKFEGRGGVTQVQMTEAELLKLICENITHNEDELTGGVEEIEKGVIGINIHEQLQYEFYTGDLLSNEEKIDLLLHNDILWDNIDDEGVYNVGGYKFTLDEGYYIVGFDREGNVEEVEFTEEFDYSEYDFDDEHGDIDYRWKDDFGVLCVNKGKYY